MKGIVVFYLNRDPAPTESELAQWVQLMIKINEEVIKKIHAEGYEVMYVPTTNESTRAEKVDFSKKDIE